VFVKEVVVVLPFEPVIPIKRPSRKRSASSDFAPDGDTLARAAAARAHLRARRDSERSGPVRKMNFAVAAQLRLRPQSGVGAIASPFASVRASVAVTFRAPRRRRRARVATPVLASPNDQHALAPATQNEFGHLCRNILSANRKFITSSAQNSAKNQRGDPKPHDALSIRSNRAISKW